MKIHYKNLKSRKKILLILFLLRKFASLRLKSINQKLSLKFRNYTGNDRPVVLAHGLFGNLFSMEELGLKIATDQKYSGEYVRDT